MAMTSMIEVYRDCRRQSVSVSYIFSSGDRLQRPYLFKSFPTWSLEESPPPPTPPAPAPATPPAPAPAAAAAAAA